MKTCPPFLAALVLAAGLAASAPAYAGLVRMTYTGSVVGYFSLDIVQDDFPIGTPLSMTLTYDDSFIGAPAGQLFLGMAPAITGTMTLAGGHYTIDAMRLTYFSYGATINDPSPNYGFHVSGTGPATDEGEVFSGLDLYFGGGSLGQPTLVGFGNTNWMVANNGYLIVSGTASHERLSGSLPAPGTAALLLAALAAWGALRRGRSSSPCRSS